MPNAQPDEVSHFAALQRTQGYLKIAQLEDGCLYLIHARNSHVGQWRAREKCFTILREKCGERFLASECHWDVDECGTAKPFLKVAGPPGGTDLFGTLESMLQQIPYREFMARTQEWASA